MERKASLTATSEAEDEYILTSRCTSVSTYTNELEMDALERRRSLVLCSPFMPVVVDDSELLDEELLAMQQQQKLQHEHQHQHLGYVPKGRSIRRQMSLTVERGNHTTSGGELCFFTMISK